MTDHPNLKPEDRALIERDLVMAIVAACHQQPMTSPSAIQDVLNTPQVRSALDAARQEGRCSPTEARASGEAKPSGEVEPVAWRWRYPNTEWNVSQDRKNWFDDKDDERLIVQPLYAAAPAQLGGEDRG